MSDQNRKSIFSMFPNYESKLGDWQTEKKEKKIDNIKILSIDSKQIESTDDNEFLYTIKIILSSALNKNRVDLEVEGKILQTYQNSNVNELHIYYADLKILIPISFLEKEYILTGRIIDLVNNKVTDNKQINLKIKDVTETENPNLTGCGIEFRDQIKCYRYKDNYGPAFIGKLKMSNYSKWDYLLTSNKITKDEKEIVIAMSENEGNLDAINAYDNQIVSIGAMQKTVNQQGYGELPIQIWEFGLEYPNKYKSLLLNCGWKVEEEIEKVNGKEIVNYKIYYNEITGNKLYKKIRIGFNKENQGKKVVCIPIEPLIRLTKDENFQAKQIEDFIDRMNVSLQKKPTGYSFKISDFIKSNLGKALVLDNDVNRPAQTKSCFGESLDAFFKKNLEVSKNPIEWEENHSIYEIEILNIYGPLRGRDAKSSNSKNKAYTMTDAKLRFNNLKSKLK